MLRHPLLLIAAILVISPFYLAQAQEAERPGLKILKTFGYLDATNNYIVLGEVENTGPPAQFIQVVADYFDENHVQITSAFAAIVLERLNTNQISPFKIVLSDPSMAELVKSFTVKVESTNPAEEKPRVLDVIFHKIEPVGESLLVSGRVVNDGTAFSKNTRIVVVLYNSLGQPVSLAWTFTDPKDVLPNGSGVFSLEMKVGRLGSVAGYAIYSESTQYTEVKRVLKLETVDLEELSETVRLKRLDATNVGGSPVDTVQVGETVLFKASLANNIPQRQQFMYILQIKDRNDYVISISWLVDNLDIREDLEVALAWTPTEEGTYRAEAFIWNNLEAAVPLSFRTDGRGVTVGA